MLKVLLTGAALAAGLLAVGQWTPVQAQPAASASASDSAAAPADNPWKPVTAHTLPRAINAIEKFAGGQVLEIRYRVHRGVPGFDAVVAKNGAFDHLRVDIPSNSVSVITETELPAWMADWVLKADAKSLQKAKLPLSDAVLKAEGIAGEPAVDAGIAKPLTGGNDVLAYNIQFMGKDRPHRMAIDAVTGLQIADPNALLEAWDPEKALHESLKKASRSN
jgi:hypothetical protein